MCDPVTGTVTLASTGAAIASAAAAVVPTAATVAAAAPWVAGGSALLGAGSTILGASQQANAQRQAADAIATQNRATQQAQIQGFSERLDASNRQNQAQMAIATRQQGDRETARQIMRENQEAALRQGDKTLAQENTTADQLRGRGDAVAQDLLTATSGTAFDKSRSDYQTNAENLLAANLKGSAVDPYMTNPAGGGSGGTGDASATVTDTGSSSSDPAVRDATARRMGLAAANIRQYGKDLARVGSYGQPLVATGQALGEAQGGIMPIESAAKLLYGGAAQRLVPSQLRFRQAGEEGAQEIGAIDQRANSLRDVAALGYSNDTTLANLGQSNSSVNAANVARQTTSNAEWEKQMGGLFSGLGGIGLYGGGMYGPNVRSGTLTRPNEANMKA
jgi:hypothetical protein